MSSVTRTRYARGQGGQLRDDLMDASLTVLAVTGDPEDVSIRAVAKAVGVSPTAVYQHFEDRDALLEAACERAFEHFTAVIVEATAGVDDPFERLSRSGLAYLRYSTDEPGLYRVLFSNPLHLHIHDKDMSVIDADSAGSNAFVVLVEMVRECLEAGAPASTAVFGHEADPVYLSFQVWTWLHGIVDLRITHPGMPWPPAEEMVLDVQRLLGLDPPAAKSPKR